MDRVQILQKAIEEEVDLPIDFLTEIETLPEFIDIDFSNYEEDPIEYISKFI